MMMSTDAAPAPSAPPARPLTTSAAMLALVAAASSSTSSHSSSSFSSSTSSWPQRAEAVRALKNDVIGNKGRKAAYVRLGAVQALVRTLLAALEERVVFHSFNQYIRLTAPWNYIAVTGGAVGGSGWFLY